MKILVFGAGAVGSVFGGFLSKEHDVTLLGRKSHLNAIRKKGLTISGIWGRHHFKKFVLETEAEKLIRQKSSFDLILITVKSYDTLKTAKIIRRFIHPQTVVLSLQNGLGNAEALKSKINPKQILAGRVIFGAAIPEPGQVKITVMAEPTAIGEATQKKITPRVQEIAKTFNKAGVPTIAAPDIERLLWRKVVYNCALNPLASLIGCHYGFLTEHQDTRLIMDVVINEIYAVAKRAKVKIEPGTAEEYRKVFYSKLVPFTYNHRPSMLQDLEKGKKTEIEAMSGAITKLGRKYKVPTPVNRALFRLVRKREKQ